MRSLFIYTTAYVASMIRSRKSVLSEIIYLATLQVVRLI
jgi:hypothetical protein